MAIISWPVSRIPHHGKAKHAQMVIQPHLHKKNNNNKIKENSTVVAKTKFKDIESKANYLK